MWRHHGICQLVFRKIEEGHNQAKRLSDPGGAAGSRRILQTMPEGGRLAHFFYYF
jgi:hypothetical protein